MSESAHNHTTAHSRDLDALLSAIADGIDALVAWDIAAFESAVERQSSICTRLTAGCARSAADLAVARKVRDSNRVYGRMLQHSIHWTRTLGTILQAGGHLPTHSTVHFRG